ncbi:MAG: RNA polymerase sigma factor RpoD/SigA [Saprospiraceae bacterium]|nr:RNA polymerase sigma factor RpoD/SigA [Lewinellaceae bacterium]
MRALKITQSITRRDEKSLEKYLTEISRYDVLAPEEEVQLFQRIREGDEEALVKVVRHNLRFVVSVAKQYQNLGLWLGDLVNEGNIGLIKAARRFDETRGFKFISYAVWWIRQSILQAVNDKAQKIRVPLNLKGVGAKVRASHQEILQKQEREPTLEELAEATGLTPELVKKSLDTYKMCSSLDAPLSTEGEGSLVHVLEDESIEQPDYELSIRESQKEEVQQLLSLLTPRQATVLSMYYGIGRKQPASLGDIGEHIGLSRERVRQIMNRGVRKLRLRARKMDPTFSVN